MKKVIEPRIVLMYIWILPLLFITSVLSLFLVFGSIEAIDYWPAMKSVNKVYAPFISAILIYFFATNNKRKSKKELKSLPRLIIYLGPVVWNSLIMILFIPFVFKMSRLEDAMENIEGVNQVFSWIVGASMGYFFGQVV